MGRSSGSDHASRPLLASTPAGRALRAAIEEVLAGAGLEECAARHGLPAEALMKALAQADDARSAHGGRNRTTRASALLRRKLTPEQELELHALVRGHLPDELGLQALLWNRDALSTLIERRTGFALPQRTLTTYMERWGFAPEKPLRNLYRQQPAAMREWMRRDYPVIALQARDAFAVLAWWGSLPVKVRDRARSVPGGRLWTNPALNIMFAVTNRGHMQWLIHDGAADQDLTIGFVERLATSAVRPIALIVQDQPCFATPAFIEWSLRNKHRIVFNLLPPSFNMAAGEREES